MQGNLGPSKRPQSKESSTQQFTPKEKKETCTTQRLISYNHSPNGENVDIFETRVNSILPRTKSLNVSSKWNSFDAAAAATFGWIKMAFF